MAGCITFILKIIGVILLIIIGLYFVLFIAMNWGNINVFEKNNVKVKTQQYLINNYPDMKFKVYDIKYDWKATRYEISFSDDANDTKKYSVSYTTYDKKFESDQYKRPLIEAEKKRIEDEIHKRLGNFMKDMEFVSINIWEEDFKIKLDTNKNMTYEFPIDCTVYYKSFGGKAITLSKGDFLDESLKIKEIVYKSSYKLKKLEFQYGDMTKPAYYLLWKDEMNFWSYDDVFNSINEVKK